MKQNHSMRTAFIGSYVPRRCGIATFTHNLASAVAEHAFGESLSGNGSISIVAMNDRDGEYKYEAQVKFEIGQQRREDYRNAAEVLNTSGIDAVSLQHEYGLYGGEAGNYLMDLLDRVSKPVVSTLHTVLSEPSPPQLDILQRICRRSSAVVVMASRAKTILAERYGIPVDHVRLIPHGVPDVPFVDTASYKDRFGLAGRSTILTFGLLGPGKGIETMLDALAKVVPDHPDVTYIILGVTHPAVRRESGELYRLSLERRAVELGIQENVLFHNRYVSDHDLREYLLASDIYATPYRTKEQITSGTLAYALATGRAVISTPYWHAQELLASGRGRLAGFDDVNGFADHIRELLENTETREGIRRRAYEFGREMTWASVGKRYAETFETARASFPDVAAKLVTERKVLMRMSLPSIRLEHLLTMTDDTGMLQHSVYATPDRHHGYCTDDNARALIVSAMAWSLIQDERVLPYLHIYLGFLHFAYMPERGRFRNFMSYDRRWLEDDGSDDSQGRALWALGHLICHAPNESTARLSTDLFRHAASRLESLTWPRSWALSILGLHYYLRQQGDDNTVRAKMETIGKRLNDRFAEHETSDWPWFEDVVTYDNGRLPQALIIAGLNLDRQDMVDRGLRVLEWLVKVQTADKGHLSVIGNNGWLRRTGDRAVFDQQALEPAALIGACKAAYRASGDSKWLAEMRRCFEWYVGRNDLGIPMIDFKSRGCYDGLKPDGVNSNQGAESVLSWLLSLLIMREMQTGDAPDVG